MSDVRDRARRTAGELEAQRGERFLWPAQPHRDLRDLPPATGTALPPSLWERIMARLGR